MVPATRVISGDEAPTLILRIMLLPMSAMYSVSTPPSLVMKIDFGWSRAIAVGAPESVEPVVCLQFPLVGSLTPVPA